MKIIWSIKSYSFSSHLTTTVQYNSHITANNTPLQLLVTWCYSLTSFLNKTKRHLNRNLLLNWQVNPLYSSREQQPQNEMCHPECFALSLVVTACYDSSEVKLLMLMLSFSICLTHWHTTWTSALPFPLWLCVRASCTRDRTPSERWISAHVSDFIFDFLCKQTKDKCFHLRLGMGRPKHRESNSPSLFLPQHCPSLPLVTYLFLFLHLSLFLFSKRLH